MVDFHKQRVNPATAAIMSRRKLIDKHIEKAAKQFPIDKINRADLAILRLAVYELLVEKRQPQKVIIDEAIELAKEFGGETSPSFVNGALGSIITHEKPSKI